MLFIGFTAIQGIVTVVCFVNTAYPLDSDLPSG